MPSTSSRAKRPATSPVAKSWLMYSRNASSLTSASVKMNATCRMAHQTRPLDVWYRQRVQEQSQKTRKIDCRADHTLPQYCSGCSNAVMYVWWADLHLASLEAGHPVQRFQVFEQVRHVVGLCDGDLERVSACTCQGHSSPQ